MLRDNGSAWRLALTIICMVSLVGAGTVVGVGAGAGAGTVAVAVAGTVAVAGVVVGVDVCSSANKNTGDTNAVRKGTSDDIRMN